MIYIDGRIWSHVSNLLCKSTPSERPLPTITTLVKGDKRGIEPEEGLVKKWITAQMAANWHLNKITERNRPVRKLWNYQMVIHPLRRSLLIFQDISDLDKGIDMGCLKIRYTLKWPSYRVPQAANKLKWLVALIIATDLGYIHVSHFFPCALWTLPKNSFLGGHLECLHHPKIQTCELDFFGAF